MKRVFVTAVISRYSLCPFQEPLQSETENNDLSHVKTRTSRKTTDNLRIGRDNVLCHGTGGWVGGGGGGKKKKKKGKKRRRA